MKRKIILVAFIMLMLPLLSGFAFYHRYGPFMGKVIDVETKEPIEGAAVLAVYYTYSSTVGGRVSHYTNAQEAVTDAKGEFRIPPLKDFTFKLFGHHDEQVRFTIFKSGYGAFGGTSQSQGVFIDGMKSPNSFLPQDKHILIELPQLKTKEEIRWNLPSIEPNAPHSKQRNLIKLIDEERIKLGLEQRYK